MKVTAILRKDQPHKDKLCKVVIRISNGFTRQFAATPIKVLPAQFKKGKIINHPEAGHLNLELAKYISDYERLFATSKTSFHQYALTFIAHHEKAGTRGAGTVRYYKSQVNKFILFAGDVSLHKITTDLLKQYMVYLRSIGNDHNTVWSSLKFIKMLLNAARKEGVIRHSPFETFPPMTYKQTTRAFLTSEEVRKIAGKELEKGSILYNIQKWFLIQCYTGLRAGDLAQLNKERILSEGRIIIDTKKTQTPVSIPLSEETRQLISDAQPFTITLENYNVNLKALASACGITKNLTSHMARHSAGMRMAELGISKEVASKVLGHKKSATTDIYYKIQDERVNSEMAKFKF